MTVLMITEGVFFRLSWN